MNKLKCTVTRLLFQIGLLVVLYSLCRLFFLLLNKSYFIDGAPFSSVLMLFVHGLRFDFSAIFMTNVIFIILSLLPFPFIINSSYQKVLKYLFIISNSFFVLMNCIDIAYFPYVQKRMQADALLFLNGEKGDDFFRLIPTFIAGYWYIWTGYILLVILLWRGYKYSLSFKQIIIPGKRNYFFASVVCVAGIGISVIAIRGGFQLKPLDIIQAAEITDPQHIPAVLNSPFSVIKTYNKKSLPHVSYYPENLLSNCEKGLHNASADSVSNKQNVVIIIVESLSKEYISFFNGKSQTPFLDSLFSHSLVFSNAFANAKESIQGIPAVLASIPSCQDDPFIFSPYSGNDITSIANLLKPMGYQSAFFHGGSTGTMGFNSFCKLAGFNNYYGREDYNNEKDFDGDWGIWDEPFLQYMAGKLSTMPQPFVASVFTLNTHHPFSIPAQYKNKFTHNGHPILSCVRYADYALEQFFKTIKNAPWFNNTLFVITADHTGPLLENKNALNNYRIPIAFYKPDGSLHGIKNEIASQIDILPSVMHQLNYPYNYFSLGHDLFDTDCDRFAVNYNAGIYECIDSSYCYQFSGEKGIGFYNWKLDSSFNKNLNEAKSKDMKSSDEKLKRFIQVFNGSLINDKMRMDSDSKDKLTKD